MKFKHDLYNSEDINSAEDLNGQIAIVSHSGIGMSITAEWSITGT